MTTKPDQSNSSHQSDEEIVVVVSDRITNIEQFDAAWDAFFGSAVKAKSKQNAAMQNATSDDEKSEE